jgi:uncharacterized protein
MNPLLKNLLGLALIVSLGGAIYLGFLVTKTYDRSSEPSNFRSFTVQGEGKAVGVPDIASFSFDVITEGNTDLAALQSENAEKMNKALDFVTKKGVDKKDIKTAQYIIQPRYESTVCDYSVRGSVCPPAEIVGYTVQQTTYVKIRDFKLISPLLAGVVESGANSVSGLQFSLDEKESLENSARAEAIKKAQEKAASIAKVGGFELGRLLEISENNGGYTPYYARTAMMDAVGGSKEASTAPAIEAGSQEINVQVNLKYEIR